MSTNGKGRDSSEAGESKGQKPTYSTRVFKKASPNNKITAYLGRRDFFDNGEKVDIVDGVVLVDKDYMNRETGWKVFVHLLAAFRYGREDLESVTGLLHKKDIYSKFVQVYPPLEDEDRKITRLQDRLIKKLGDSAFPFMFELPRHLAASVSIHPGPSENGKPCGVDYQLSSFIAFSSDERAEKKNSVRMAIKKLNLATDPHKKQPSIDLKKDFVLSNYPVCIEARLDKELYIHGEDVQLFLNIDNRSSKTLKGIGLEIKQYADVTISGVSATYKAVVAQVDSEVGFPVNPSSHLSQTYSLLPSMDCNTRQEGKRGCALDGQFKVGDSNLAASSVINDNPTQEMKEAQAILVQYKLKVKLSVVRGTDIKFDLPFRLAHNRPAEPVFVRKSGPEGGQGQYVSVTKAEAANLMSTMSEMTSRKKTDTAAAAATAATKKVEQAPLQKQDSGSCRIAGPPQGQTVYAQVNKKATQAAAAAAAPAPQQQQQQPEASQSSGALIDLLMFDPGSSTAAPAPAAAANVSTNASFDQLFGASPAQQPNTTSVAMQSQPQAQGFGMPMQQQPQQAFGQMNQQFMPQQAAGFMPQQAAMPMTMNPFGGQPQQQPFMVAQQQNTFGGMVPQQMGASNPFATGMQQPVQQAFVQQQQPNQMQNFMMMGQAPQAVPQQQQPFQANFGAVTQPQQQQAKPAAKPVTDDDMFFEEFVSMRMDGTDA